ncbi:MAG: hypothetical protein WEE66_08600 [Actinomycetota bacterium]
MKLSTAVLSAVVLTATLLTGGVARAMPSTTPTNAYGVDGKVRAVLQVGSNVWVGGRFTQVVSNTRAAPAEDADEEINLAVFTLKGVPLDFELDLGGTSSIVYDLALAPDGITVYAAGRFSAEGAANLVAFNGITGARVQAYSTPPLFSAHDDGPTLWAGGRHLYEVMSPTRERQLVSVATKDIGNHVRDPQVVDIASAPQGGVFIACKCDVLNGRSAKAFAHVERDGNVDRTWRPTRFDSASFGWEVLEAGGVTYLSAGGSDYVQAVDSLTGATLWKTDANGQVQTAALHGDRLVIGGHWRLVESYCQPRLAALDPMTGSVDRTWTPAPNQAYAGVWALASSTDGALWAGGEFTHVGSDWERNGLACLYKNGDQTKPLHVSPNPWAQALARFP